MNRVLCCLTTQVAQQICFADRVLLNKVDLVTPSELASTRTLIGKLNGTAKIFETTRGQGADFRELLGIQAFDPSRHQVSARAGRGCSALHAVSCPAGMPLHPCPTRVSICPAAGGLGLPRPPR